MDKTAERNRRRRERVLEQYKIGYCMPYCIAFVNGSEDMDKLLTRCIDFKMGVAMADSKYPKWNEKFNDVYHECMRIVTGEGVQKE